MFINFEYEMLKYIFNSSSQFKPFRTLQVSTNFAAFKGKYYTDKQGMIPFSWRAHRQHWHLAGEVTTNLCVSHTVSWTAAFLPKHNTQACWGDALQYANRDLFPDRRSQDIQTKCSAWNLNDFSSNPLHKGLFVASGEHSKHRFSCAAQSPRGEWD